jgi:hypothetical protein
MKRLALLLLLASPAFAQTVQHVSTTTQSVSVSAVLPQPQAQGDTLLVGVYPSGGTLTDTAGDTFVQDCTGNGLATFRASSISANPSNRLTYTIPASGYIGVFANEQTGRQIFVSCQSSSGAGPFISTAPAGSLVYAMLSSSACCSGTVLGPGMSILDGLADTWFGANIYSGWTIDAVGIPTGPVYTYSAGQNGSTGNVLMAAYANAPPPPPQPFVWVMPGLGTATFPMQIPPACGPNDGTCSIAIQVCDTSQTPPLCMTAPIGTLSLIKTISLPTPQVQTIPVVTVTNP